MLPQGFREMMMETFSEEVATRLCAALEDDTVSARTSIRLNPFKFIAEQDVPAIHGACEVPMSDSLGFFLPARPSFISDPLFHQGVYYVQDSSSMIVGEVFRILASSFVHSDRPVRILDLCAAPGGKTTDLAASARKLFGDNYILVANEPISSRAGVLKENVVKWGDPNVVVISNDPSRIAQALGGWFDIVLADVPCSGEGMFRKEASAVSDWSPEAVENCVKRSKRIVAGALDCLHEGGYLIFSTCTFNHRENEEVPGGFVSQGIVECCTPEFNDSRFLKTRYGYTLAPGWVDGEGQSFSAFREISGYDSNDGDAHNDGLGQKVLKSDRYARSLRPNQSKIPLDLTLYFNSKVIFQAKGDFIKALPSSIAGEIEIVEKQLSVLSSGVLAFEIKGHDAIPQQDLAWSIIFEASNFPHVEVDLQTALKYLSRENIVLSEAPRGIILLTFGGRPLSYCKNLGNRVNNLYPKGSAIRLKLF